MLSFEEGCAFELGMSAGFCQLGAVALSIVSCKNWAFIHIALVFAGRICHGVYTYC